MSDELRRQLQLLEDDYPGQPLIAQQADLVTINQLRTRLGMPLVDASLQEIGAAKQAKPQPVKAKPKDEPDHTEARQIYEEYLKKNAELEVHRAYAERVAKATSGPGQTPVKPLATMGTNGGPLLCDHCRKPIVLEGGQYHGMNADAAWAKNPRDKWNSWILGGMVVEIQTNGTLRIYHGYPGGSAKHCCNAASRADTKAREAFGPRKGADQFVPLLAFFEDEFPDLTDRARQGLANEVLDALFAYDPGLGVNRPPADA